MLHNQHVVAALFTERERNLVEYTRGQAFPYAVYVVRADDISQRIDREMYPKSSVYFKKTFLAGNTYTSIPYSEAFNLNTWSPSDEIHTETTEGG